MRSAAARGTSYGAPTEGEVSLAEAVCDRFATVESIRMVNSGTEASMSAIRLARAATGREKLLKFAGAYHGHVDGLLAEAGSGLATQAIPASPGVPPAQAAATIVVPWNDPDAVAAALAEHEVAAILAEPIPANMGVVPPAPGFLERLRALADEHGALLILDEVISGFRVARGGAQELLGVGADLTVIGKVLGGGLPAAAYGGRARLDVHGSRRRATSTRRARCRAIRSRSPPGWRPWPSSTRAPMRDLPSSPSGSRPASSGRRAGIRSASPPRPAS